MTQDLRRPHRRKAPASRIEIVLTLTAALLVSTTAHARMPAPSVEPPDELIEEDQFEPRPTDFSRPDSIQLGSGEWLQGSVDRIRDHSLEFDSDDLDSLTLDFDDVYAVVTAGPHSLLFEGREAETGWIAIRGDIVRIRTGDIVQTFDRKDMVAMVPGRLRESNYWSGKVSAGLTAQSGNTNQTDFSALASLTRETPLTRMTARYNGIISEVNGNTTANNHRVNTQADIFLSRRFYVTVLSFGIRRHLGQPGLRCDVRLGPQSIPSSQDRAAPDRPGQERLSADLRTRLGFLSRTIRAGTADPTKPRSESSVDAGGSNHFKERNFGLEYRAVGALHPKRPSHAAEGRHQPATGGVFE